jgi:hypothetical protein
VWQMKSDLAQMRTPDTYAPGFYIFSGKSCTATFSALRASVAHLGTKFRSDETSHCRNQRSITIFLRISIVPIAPDIDGAPLALPFPGSHAQHDLQPFAFDNRPALQPVGRRFPVSARNRSVNRLIANLAEIFCAAVPGHTPLLFMQAPPFSARYPEIEGWGCQFADFSQVSSNLLIGDAGST